MNDEAVQLMHIIEQAPKHVLLRRIRKCSDSQALLDLLNAANERTRQGLTAQWGRLSYEEIGELTACIDRRVEWLQQQAVTAHNKQQQAIQERPYLAPSLKGFDPRGSQTTNNETHRRHRPVAPRRVSRRFD